jgi:hypothetical protein
MNGKECSDCSQWNQIVLDMRKLREALTAIGERESKFAGETFELSVDINIQV